MMRERYSWRKSICRCLIMVAPRAGQYRQAGSRHGLTAAGHLLLEHDLFRKPVPTFLSCSNISHIYHSPAPRSISRRRRPCTLDHASHGGVPARRFRLARKNNLSAFNDIETVGEIGHVVNIRLGDEHGMAE